MMLEETKQQRFSRSAQELIGAMSEYDDAAWPGQIVYLLECLQTLGRENYETRLEALAGEIRDRLEAGHW